jgi:hypothetical protein
MVFSTWKQNNGEREKRVNLFTALTKKKTFST